jgi:hypothetical protein
MAQTASAMTEADSDKNGTSEDDTSDKSVIEYNAKFTF